MRRWSACGSSPAATAPTPCWSASAARGPCAPPHWSPARAARWAASACRTTTASPAGQETFFGNIHVAGGPAPVRAYIAELLPDVMEGRVEPGLVFDRTVDLDGVPDGYRAMNAREALKVMIRP